MRGHRLDEGVQAAEETADEQACDAKGRTSKQTGPSFSFFLRHHSLASRDEESPSVAPRSSPSSEAMVFIASISNWMCSVRSTPKSAAPRSMSSRLTLRAKPLAF